jgi:hypothetical protein
MSNRPIEAQYPLSFRKNDTKALAEALKRHQSIELIGMKRVGISNFLRFFLYSDQVNKKYFSSTKESIYLFIPVDYNNLIERERYPFWLLTFKRILDAVEHSELPDNLKHHVEKIFDTSIQYKEAFFIVDGMRKALVELTKNNVVPVLFMIRFDRLLDSVTPEMFANLQGFYDACREKLVYVFTSYQQLHYLKPEIFDKHSMAVFSKPMYVQPAENADMDIIFTTFEDKYKLKIDSKVKRTLISMSGGHVNYLQLSLIILNERISAGEKIEDILDLIEHDERIELQSEELFSYLDKDNQDLLLQIANQENIQKSDSDQSEYVWRTGMIVNGRQPARVFSPLFEKYLKGLFEDHPKNSEETYLTSKEHKLFSLLKEHLDEICERELILETVWAEYEAIGVSDWAVDRLVAFSLRLGFCAASKFFF